MASIVKRIEKQQLTKGIPSWLSSNVMYETIMGSVAYGVSSDTSDTDVYGFCIPKKEMIFPHLAGHINGFGTKPQSFDQWSEHHIQDPSAGKEYDVTIFSIVKYFQLAMENNPNVLETLFTPQNCVLHSTRIGNMVRENRKLFLHKGCFHKLKGYSFSQLHKATIKTPEEGSKRYEDVQKHGFDCKFLYHVVRLLDEAEQILETGDLNLQRDRERLKAIRRGEISFEEVKKFFELKERALEKLYHESKLRHSPDEEAIKQLLLNCLEEHYGNLDSAIVQPHKAIQALKDINEILQRNSRIIG